MTAFDGKISLLSCCKAAMYRHKAGLARSRRGINRRICCKLHNDVVEKSEICYIARVRFFLYTGFIENLFLINLDGAFSLPYCLLPQGPLRAPAMLASPPLQKHCILYRIRRKPCQQEVYNELF